MITTIVGVFKNHRKAKKAIQDLDAAGFNPQNISIVLQNRTEGDPSANSLEAHIAGGAATGMLAGAIIGGIAGILIHTSILHFSGIITVFNQPVVTILGLTGIWATMAEGILSGAITGGLIGAVLGMAFPEEDSVLYENQAKAGEIVLAIPTETKYLQEAKSILVKNNARHIKIVGEPPQPVENEAMETYTIPRLQPSIQPAYAFAPVGYKGGKSKTRKKTIKQRENKKKVRTHKQ